MDEDNRFCLGCKRRLGEIARWSAMSDAERAALIDELPKRAAVLREPSRPTRGGLLDSKT